MVNCFAAGCDHTSESHTCRYFRFPKEGNAEYRRWVSMCRRADKEPTVNSRLCSCHFKDQQRKNGPTIFERNQEKVMNFPSPEKRRRRLVFKSPIVEKPEESEAQEDEACTAAASPALSPDPRTLQAENAVMQAEILTLQQQVDELNQQLQYVSVRTTYSKMKSSAKLVHHYTGLPSPQHFDDLHCLCNRFDIQYVKGWKVLCLTTEDQLLLTLMKLRLDFSFIDLAERFGVTEPTVNNIFYTWLYVLYELLVVGLLDGIPSLRKNQACLPGCFAEFGNCRIVLDCSEMQVANARDNMETQKQTYSHYKSRNTFKVLIGVAPNGVITYVSEFFPGSKSDKQIVKESGILKYLEPGDLVLADKGFLIQDILPAGVTLNIPPFLTNGVFTRQESILTLKIARARIHVERAIGRMKQYSILNFIPHTMRRYATMIVKVCGALVNLQNPLIDEISEQL